MSGITRHITLCSAFSTTFYDGLPTLPDFFFLFLGEENEEDL